MSNLDICTVFYGGDIPLLLLQARSLARFFDPGAVQNIFLVENDLPGVLEAASRTRLQEEYGPLWEKVRIVNRSELGAPDQGFKGPLAGWRLQQALKLAMGRLGTAPGLLILDSKNHFVAPVGHAEFFTPEGRARHFFSRKYSQQLVWLRASLDYYQQPFPGEAKQYPPTITPYPLTRALLREVEAQVETRSGGVYALMADEGFKGTEFYLIYAHVMWRDGDLSAVFEPGHPAPASIFASWPEREDDLQRVLDRVSNGQARSFALHARRKRPLNACEWAQVHKIWKERDLLIPEVVEFYEATAVV